MYYYCALLQTLCFRCLQWLRQREAVPQLGLAFLLEIVQQCVTVSLLGRLAKRSENEELEEKGYHIHNFPHVNGKL